MKHRYLLLYLCVQAACLRAQSPLPLYEKEKIAVQADWLVDPVDARAGVYATPEGYLALSNGLVSRTFTLQPNVACVELEELGNRTSFLRSVRLEAIVTIDGFRLPVGGLAGQPVHNYLLKEWIPDLTVVAGSYRLAGYRVNETEERFPWRKRAEWMPKDMPWPAPGKELTFTYRLDDEAIRYLASHDRSDDRRQVILSDDFKELSPAWTLVESKAHPRNSFVNEGKNGEIMALANTAVYAERDFQEGTQVVLARIDPGTDRSAGWGPGLGVVFDDKTVKINLRAGESKIGFYDGKTERTVAAAGSERPVWLRIELKPGELEASFSPDGIRWEKAGACPTAPGQLPRKVRVGKMDNRGGAADGPLTGDAGRCLVGSFRLLGAPPAEPEQESLARLGYLKQVEVEVHYELYDGLPVFCKWLTVRNRSGRPVTVDRFTSEILALTEAESAVDSRRKWLYPNITVETDYNFGGMSEETLDSSSIAWKADPLYATQVNYDRSTPCLLEAAPKIGPAQTVEPAGEFRSFRVWELLHDSWDRERKSLAYRRMMRSVAPWVTENPVLMHVRSSDDAAVKKAIDQCADVGFEMVVMTFWSGFDAEDDSPANRNRMKALAGYARSKNIALGGYSLLASRRIDAANDVVLPRGKRPRFGNSPCLESEWGHAYFRKLYALYEETGLEVFEHDGSYPGDWCYSRSHPGHQGAADSQWNQFRRIAAFYKWCRGRGVYLNVPDAYFLNGSSKIGMGYREANWSLPRAQQEIIERQNIFDGTWNKTPSMGWMFVPLVEYQGGGEAATIEPLKDHLDHYNQRLANLFGAGVQACYRGPQLYDTPRTREVVAKWVAFYKKHREVLDGDIVHLRRPDGQDYDAILHVNPFGREKGMLVVYNPLNQPIERTLKIDLYYTGLKRKVRVTASDGSTKKYRLSAGGELVLPVSVAAKGMAWFVLEE